MSLKRPNDLYLVVIIAKETREKEPFMTAASTERLEHVGIRVLAVRVGYKNLALFGHYTSLSHRGD